jgi:hypothetical protein
MNRLSMGKTALSRIHSRLELTLAIHCAPVLAGYKPAALFPRPVWLEAGPAKALRLYGLHYLALRRRDGKELIFAYCPALMSAVIGHPTARCILSDLGYPVEESAEDCLAFLVKRFKEAPDFPHEVGFFLGYLPEDVLGFIRHRGANCKFCGMWKVYSDEEKAGLLFREYSRCKQLLLGHIKSGGTLLSSNLSAILAG